MKYNAQYFRENIPVWKRKRDPVIDRYIYRPISFYTAALCANMGVGANTVSNISTLVGIVASVLIGIPNFITGIIGSALLNVWVILDDTDGNLARQIKKQPYGEYLDAMSSYLLIGFLFVALGFRSCCMGRLLFFKSEFYILLGALTSVCGVLMSLLYLKFVLVSKDLGLEEKLAYDGSNSSNLMKLKTKIDMNLSVGGILPALVLFFTIINICEIIVIVWFLYHTFEFIATVIYFLYKAKRNIKISS